MTISVQEGSEYFRGLLILISKDRRVTDEEMVLMRRIGKASVWKRSSARLPFRYS